MTLLSWDRDIFFGNPADDEWDDEVGVGAPDDWGYIYDPEDEDEDEDEVDEFFENYDVEDPYEGWDDDKDDFDGDDLDAEQPLDYSLYLY